MPPEFRPPGFLKPKTFEAIDRIPETLDDVFRRIREGQQRGKLEGRQADALQRSLDAQERREGFEDEDRRIAADARGTASADRITRIRQELADKYDQDPTKARLGQFSEEGQNEIVTKAQQKRVDLSERVKKRAEELGMTEQQTMDLLVEVEEGLRKAERAEVVKEEVENLKREKFQTDINETKAKTGKLKAETAQLGQPKPSTLKPPPGFRFTPVGDLEAIPGGPAAIKAEESKAERKLSEDKRASATRLQLGTAATVLTRIEQGIELADGFFTTGIFGVLPMPGTDARSLQGVLNTVKGNLGFDKLQSMRASSPTGGALGQVSERELTLLMSTVASLDQAQDGDDLKERLKEVQGHYRRWLSTIETKETTASGRRTELKALGFPDEEIELMVAQMLNEMIKKLTEKDSD